MDEATDWNDLKLRLISALFLIFVSSFCVYYGNHFLHFLLSPCWSNALELGKMLSPMSNQAMWFSAISSMAVALYEF